MTAEVCFKGWAQENGNSQGRCCCNCQNRRPIVRHPWNKELWAKGPVTSQMGWGCKPPELAPEIYFFSLEHEHGMCECHEWSGLTAKKEIERTQNEQCTGR